MRLFRYLDCHNLTSSTGGHFMNVYGTKAIRNVVLLGHGGAGKTTAAEAMALLTGVTKRMGKVTDGNTISDYDKEEIKRQFSISTSLIPLEYKGEDGPIKINLLDTPGYFDFVGEVEEAVSVADAAVIVVNCKAGIEVGTEKAWEICEKYELPRMIFVTNMAQYAVKGYEVSALDFIVKPIDYYGFALKMKKAVRYCNSVRKNPIVIKCDAGMISLTERQIYYIEVLEHNVIYHTDKGDFSMFGSLKTEAERLGSDFVFCNRCYIINLRHVEAVTDNIVTIHGKELVISRYKKKDFMEALVAYWSKRG